MITFLPSIFSDFPSKTNSLMLLSDIALRDFSSDSFEDSTTEDSSLSVTQSTSSSVVKKENKPYQSRNALKFTRKIFLLPSRSARLPRQGELFKMKTSCALNRGTVHLENEMNAADVLQKVRTVLITLGKKRYFFFFFFLIYRHFAGAIFSSLQ